MDEDPKDQWAYRHSTAGHWLHQVAGAPEVCGRDRLPQMEHPLPHWFQQRDILPSCQSDDGARGEEDDHGCGSVKTPERGNAYGQGHPHFKQFIRKELEKETRENISPATVETEAGMVVTQSKQHQQDALEEEERLGQEEDGAVMTDLEVGGNTTEASRGDWMEEQSSEGLEKDIQPEECSVEVPGEDQTQELNTEGDVVSEDVVRVTTEVLTKEKLGEAQRYESDLQGIREKAEIAGNPCFWQGGLLMRKPYQILGKNLFSMPKIARQKVLTMAHNSPIGGHFGRERTLQTIRGRMDWPGLVRDMNRMCAACPICQKAKPASTTKAPLQPLPVIKEPLARLVGSLKHTKKGNKYLLVIMDYATK